jgi:hypothetical protein
MTAFVPDGWPLPEGLRVHGVVLEPLGPEHHERDYDAWMSSIDHIHSTAGFAPGDWDGDDWPFPMPPEGNLADLEMHAREFAAREAFAWSVVDERDGRVVGCVYIDPWDGGAHVRSWVRADRAELDEPLAEAVATWLRESWPFSVVVFPGR